jgi:hypothetical protein
VLVGAYKGDSRWATNNLEGDEHENELHSAGGGFAGSGDPRICADEPDTSTQEPAMQDQSTPAPAAKHVKAKTQAHKKMAKGKRAKVKPAAPSDDQAAPQ